MPYVIVTGGPVCATHFDGEHHAFRKE
jgi:nicotinamidase-related amidase